MATNILGKAFVLSIVSTVIEKKVLPKFGLDFLQEPSTIVPSLPRGYGLLIIVLGITYIWILNIGFMTVGPARSKYSALAQKEDEKDVQERYAYPNLYARKYCYYRAHARTHTLL
jgi:hypothetical protein